MKQLEWHPYSTDGWGGIEEGNYCAEIILGSSYYIVKDDNSFQKEYGYKNCNYKLYYGYKNVEDPYYDRDELLYYGDDVSFLKESAQEHLEKLIKGLMEYET